MRNSIYLFATVVLLAAFGIQTVDAQFIDLSEVEAGKYDNGKMWTFDYPPVGHLKETYDFQPGPEWFEKARLGALRLPNCTASFVSPYGLVLTNHHCARTSVEAVSRGDEDLLKTGFTSASLDEERHVPGLYVDQLIALEDVTNEVYAAIDGMETDAEKAAARTDAIDAISERITDAAGGADAGIVVQVINLYNGGRYSAYTFKRYSDLRLVMAPELQLGYFGGDIDNFTYPRYALDMSFLRVYDEDGEPYQPEHYFNWSAEGASEEDPVFVIGNPGSTLRLNTVSQLEWRRDVRAKVFVDLFDSRIAALEEYYAEEPSSALLNRIFSLKNGQKLYRGRLKGLHDPVIMAKRIDNEQTFLDDLEEKYGSTVSEDVPIPYASIIDDLADIQREKRTLTPEHSAFFLMTNTLTYSSATVIRAFEAIDYLNQQADGLSDNRLAETAQQIKSYDQAVGISKRFMKARLTDFVNYFGADDPAVQKALAGRTVEEAVDDVFANSVLVDAESTARALDEGTLTPDDPAVKLLAPFAQRRADYLSAWAGLTAQETELNAQHGRARFDIYGTSRPPDATFSLRIADGVVSPYEYNGSIAPAFTTFHGLYNRYYSHGTTAEGAGEWALPERWLNAPETFDRSTPFNLVTTNDIIGGNSGSPLLNSNLEVVGLIFDGNVESLPSAYIYNTDGGRAVAVDVRGMREALDEVYDMDRVVVELMEGELVETEMEADASN
jgi:hypothetical protein